MVSLNLVIFSDYAVLYSLNLNNGNLIGQFYRSNLGQTNLIVSDIHASDYDNLVFLIVQHDNGFHKIHYDPTTSTFTDIFSNSVYKPNFIEMVGGYTYIGGKLISNSNAAIIKLYDTGDNSLNPKLVMTADSSTFSVDILKTQINILPGISSSLNSAVLTPKTILPVSPGTYIPSVSDSFSSDIVFNGGFSDTYQIQESINTNVPFEFVCSISGSTTITPTIVAHNVTLTISPYVTMNADLVSFDFNTPAYVNGGSNMYYFGIQSSFSSNTATKYVTIEAYK